MAIQFKQALAIGSATIQLAENGKAATAVHLELGGLARDFSMEQAPATGDLENLQLKLKAVDFSNPNLGSQYVFQQYDANPAHYLAWDEAHETPESKSLREALERMGHIHYAIAIASLQLARQLHGANQLKPAITVLQFGIDTLGDRYSHAELLDDTPTKWALAIHNSHTDKLAEAEVLFDRVLESRLEVYKHQYFPGP